MGSISRNRAPPPEYRRHGAGRSRRDNYNNDDENAIHGGKRESKDLQQSHDGAGNDSNFVPIWRRKREEAKKKRRQQQPVPFVSGGQIRADGRLVEQQEDEPAIANLHMGTMKQEMGEDESADGIDEQHQREEADDEGEQWKSRYFLRQQHNRAVHSPAGTAANHATSTSHSIKVENGEEEEPATGTTIDWINGSDKGATIMQMMARMGYEHGKGLGRSQQGIVEPVLAVANPGKLALGAEKKKKPEYQAKPPPSPFNRSPNKLAKDERRPQTSSGIGHDQQPRQYDAGRAKRLPIETNVRQSLEAIGFGPQQSGEVWQALGVLAKYDIMNLGMGLGMVKKRCSKGNRQKRHSDANNTTQNR